jgi:nitrogen regulatory protein P-II 1
VKTVLLVCVIKRSRVLIDQVMTGFMEIGVTGATVVEGRGMGQILKQDVPIFSGLAELFPGGETDSSMIFSVVDEEVLEAAVRVVEEAEGSVLGTPGKGLVFALPVTFFKGVKHGF